MLRIPELYRSKASISASVGACLAAFSLLSSPAAAIATCGLTGQHAREYREQDLWTEPTHGLWAGPMDWTFEDWIFFDFEWNLVDLEASRAGEPLVLPDHEFNWSAVISLGDADPTGAVFHGVASALHAPVDALIFERGRFAVTLAEPIGHWH